MILRRLTIVLGLAIASWGTAFAADTAAPILPKEFGGWQMSGRARTSQDPAVADALNAALLKEYGFTDFASATYTRDDGRKLAIQAARFADATGAYGAFTYYRLPQMLPEEIGDKGASLNNRVLFYRGNILVDAVFQQLSAMSAAELRELAGLLPLAAGGSRSSPSLPGYLPTQSRVDNSIRYVVGPVGLTKTNAPLPAQLVDFGAGAEVALATYNTSGGEATLMVISYPTPQIAASSLHRLDAARPQTAIPQSRNSASSSMAPYWDRRTGPMVVVAAGALSQSEATSLLASVNYDADVTWNENTYQDKKNNLANLLVNVIILCGIIVGLMLVAGIAFGGVRVLISRVIPERILHRREEVEFIALHLSDSGEEPPDSKVSASIKAV
jgi:Family of unknown function (DUF6599)